MYREVTMIEITEVLRLWRDGVPKNARKVKGELVLARGEVTGHAHRIVEGQAFLYRLATGMLYLRVLSEFRRSHEGLYALVELNRSRHY